MPYATRADLLEENEQLWTTVESIYDELGELLGLDAANLLSLSNASVARPLRSGRERQNGGSGESQTTAPRRRTARARHPSAMTPPMSGLSRTAGVGRKSLRRWRSQRNGAPKARSYFT